VIVNWTGCSYIYDKGKLSKNQVIAGWLTWRC
jgi:hypothetical protein